MKNKYNINDSVFYIAGGSSDNPRKVTIIGLELVREFGGYVIKYDTKSDDTSSTFTKINENYLHNTRLEALKAVKLLFEEKLSKINQLILLCKD